MSITSTRILKSFPCLQLRVTPEFFAICDFGHEEAHEQNMSEKAAALKAEGNAFLKTKSYPEAVQKYTEVNEYCSTVDINVMCVYVCLGNRSRTKSCLL